MHRFKLSEGQVAKVAVALSLFCEDATQPRIDWDVDFDNSVITVDSPLMLIRIVRRRISIIEERNSVGSHESLSKARSLRSLKSALVKLEAEVAVLS